MSGCGQDINPLAVLVAKARTELPEPDALEESARSVTGRSRARPARPQSTTAAAAKWFLVDAHEGLAVLAGAIRRVPEPSHRRFMWVALAETVRLCSNSRTSTYKLHVRSAEDARRIRPVAEVFSETLARNLGELRRFRAELGQSGRLTDGRYNGTVGVRLGDSRHSVGGLHDVVLTSPPYGDNASTVPYGQASFLALAWIAPEDISPDMPGDILDSTLRIDHRSLGGSLPRRGWRVYAADALAASPTLRVFLESLSSQPPDRPQRIATFVADLAATLDPIVGRLRRTRR